MVNVAGAVKLADGEVIPKGGLSKAFGLRVLDESGLRQVAIDRHTTTYIDGGAGFLIHGGYTIGDLCENTSYSEVSYLLNEDELPSGQELEEFESKLANHDPIPEWVMESIEISPRDKDPMRIFSSAISNLGSERPTEGENAPILVESLILGTHIIRHQEGREGRVAYDPARSFGANFLRMAYGEVDSQGNVTTEFTPLQEQIAEVLFILHADHEQNCGTFTAEVASSSKPGLYAASSAGLNALLGPLHGGANVKVADMINDMVARQKETGMNDEALIGEFLNKVRAKEDKLWGCGHAVYTNVDPRATAIKDYLKELLKASGKADDPGFRIAQKIEALAVENPNLITEKKKTLPNVDFYSGLLMDLLGVDPKHFTVVFGMGRMAGYRAHCNATHGAIRRPYSAYVGAEERPVPAIEDRGPDGTVLSNDNGDVDPDTLDLAGGMR